MHRANELAGAVRPRRTLSADQLSRLLVAARCRPLAELGRIAVPRDGEPSRGKRCHWTYEPVTPANIAECYQRGKSRLARTHPERVAAAEAAGRLRALVYKCLTLTGLRLGELRSLSIGQVELSGLAPYATLKPTATCRSTDSPRVGLCSSLLGA